MPAANANQDLQKTIKDADRAWDTGSAKWFQFLLPDAIVYSIGQTQPFVGRQAYENHFRAQLTGGKRKTKVMSRHIQQLQDSAVVAQTLQILQGGIAANVRQSVIWVSNKNTGKWGIKHLHTALIGTPSAVKAPQKASAVRVLNEKIATMAAILGVAQ